MIKKLLFLTIYLGLVGVVIMHTPPSDALLHDANSYYQTAVELVNNHAILSSFFSTTPQFIDRGYPTFLALVMQIVGSNNIVALQISNYALWALGCYLITRAVNLSGIGLKPWQKNFMLFSPLFLTFSAKLYSEPFACFGTSLLIYAIATLIHKPSFVGKLSLLFGATVLFSTKSVFLPFALILAIYIVMRRQFSYLIYLLIAIATLTPSIIGASGGGRSLYNLNIQSSKVEQSYPEILSCVPYYLSYPVGTALLPSFQGVCHQNDSTPSMPGYAHNPYVLAAGKRAGDYTLSDWSSLIIHNPAKYTLVMIVSLANIIFIEGIYPNILLLLPVPLVIICYLICKIILSLYLWRSVYLAGRVNILLLAPILYFALVVTHFPVEPRYFYPLIPYLYFLALLTHNNKA